MIYKLQKHPLFSLVLLRLRIIPFILLKTLYFRDSIYMKDLNFWIGCHLDINSRKKVDLMTSILFLAAKAFAKRIQPTLLLKCCTTASSASPAIPEKSKNLAKRPSYFFLVSGDLMAYTNIEYGFARISFSFIPTTFLHLSIPRIQANIVLHQLLKYAGGTM